MEILSKIVLLEIHFFKILNENDAPIKHITEIEDKKSDNFLLLPQIFYG